MYCGAIPNKDFINEGSGRLRDRRPHRTRRELQQFHQVPCVGRRAIVGAIVGTEWVHEFQWVTARIALLECPHRHGCLRVDEREPARSINIDG